MPILSIVILNYKTPKMTTECVGSIVSIYRKRVKSGEIEIIVVDNASMDDSVEKLSKLKEIVLIKNNENSGFGQGCNIAVSKARGKYILFLNSDAQILNNKLLDMVSLFEKDKKIGAVGGRMVGNDGRPEKSTGKFYSLPNFLLMITGGERLGLVRSVPEKTKYVDWVSGGCMMVRRDIFIKIGGFHKDYFMYMEDMDLCYRIKEEGFSIYCYPQLRAKHLGQGSSNRSFAIVNIYKGLLAFFKHHKPRWQYIVVKNVLYLKALILKSFGKEAYAQAITVIR